MGQRAWSADGIEERLAGVSMIDGTTAFTRISSACSSAARVWVIEATEEAIYNSLLRAVTITGNGHTVQALPIGRTVEILRRHGALGAPAASSR